MRKPVLTPSRKRTLHDWQPRSLPGRVCLRVALLMKALVLALVNVVGGDSGNA